MSSLRELFDARREEQRSRAYFKCWKIQRPVLASNHILLGSSMLRIIGLIITASRRMTNSKPSIETSVTYLLAAILN